MTPAPGECHPITAPGRLGATDNRANPVKLRVRVEHLPGKPASVLCVLTRELRADNDRSRRRVSFCNEDRPMGYMKTGRDRLPVATFHDDVKSEWGSRRRADD